MSGSRRRATFPLGEMNDQAVAIMERSEVKPIIEDLGGEAVVRDWVERFYGRITRDSLLAPLFPEDITESRDKQMAFFVEFFGGPALYSEQYGQPFLRYRHRKVKIGRPERDAWMALLMESLREITADNDLIRKVEEKVGAMADHMINHRPDQKDAMYFN